MGCSWEKVGRALDGLPRVPSERLHAGNWPALSGVAHPGGGLWGKAGGFGEPTLPACREGWGKPVLGREGEVTSGSTRVRRDLAQVWSRQPRSCCGLAGGRTGRRLPGGVAWRGVGKPCAAVATSLERSLSRPAGCRRAGKPRPSGPLQAVVFLALVQWAIRQGVSLTGKQTPDGV